MDEVSGREARLVGTYFTEDRFGNENSSAFVAGNANSYINLGNYSALKPVCGSISLWINLQDRVWAGKGVMINPILLTKCSPLDDFYEAFVLNYMLNSHRVVAGLTYDSLQQITLPSIKPVRLNRWLHLVLCYDSSRASFYLNGNLQCTFPKRFKTQFLEPDSVLVGATGNKKNLRFLEACVDDIAFFDYVLNPAEVLELYNAPDPHHSKIILRWSLLGLGLLLFAALVFLLVRYWIKISVRRERERLGWENRLLKTELRVNRASMNPHFLFNALNTLHNLILEGSTTQADDYLLKFSQLIRRTLDSNSHDMISLEMEIDLLERYLEIESIRFGKTITYTITTDPSIVLSNAHIPVMMLQPFVENSIWHGLLSKEGEKTIDISFSLTNEGYVLCVVEDNGKGRGFQKTNVSAKRSLGIAFIRQRLDLLNRIHSLSLTLDIFDKPHEGGTVVCITLPILSPYATENNNH